MTKEIKVGSAHSTAPGVTKGTINIGETPAGVAIEAPVVILQGEAEGPVVWLHGCVHGNEYCGTYIIHEFLGSLDARTLKGTVVAIPVLNVTAFEKKLRMSPYEGFNGGDLNRQFPGVAGGTLTQQMAHALYEPLKKYADVLIDFHTALTPDVRWALFPKTGAAAETSEKIARAFGYRDTLPTPDTLLAGSAMMTAAKDGKAAFIVECGGKVRAFTDEAVTDAVERLNNALRALDMLEGEVIDYGELNYFSSFEWVTAKHGGLFERFVKCGDKVEEGTEIGRYFDMHGNERGRATAPKSGIVLAIHAGPIMTTGDTLIHIGLDPQQVRA